jgi:leucyl aminopeptidase
VIGVVKTSKGPELVPGAQDVARYFDDGPDGLRDVLTVLGMTGAAGEAVKVAAPSSIQADLVLAVGLGSADSCDTDALRQAAGTAARTLSGLRTVAVALPAETERAVEAVALGGLLGAYEFARYRTSPGGPRPMGEVVVLIEPAQRAVAEEAIERARVVGQEISRARDLINMPANDLCPQTFAAEIEAAGREYGLQVEVLDETALAEAGYGGIVAVGQGSVRPPRLVRISCTHPQARAHLAFVGKGITYDSGGISLKPVGFNEIMKRDMSGAAAVFAATVAIARLGLPVSVSSWLALAENMPSGSAMRPGDVLRMYGGKTVEVLNTDAEGRLVLADAIVRAAQDRPDSIIDVATLTAAMKMALGHRIFGVMSNDDGLRDRIVRAAGDTGEQAWPMPLPQHLRTKSHIADIANSGERMGGGLAAGIFLQEFVPDGIPWAHLDIAGPAFNEAEPYGYTPRGGTGCAVRTLVEVAQSSSQQ